MIVKLVTHTLHVALEQMSSGLVKPAFWQRHGGIHDNPVSGIST